MKNRKKLGKNQWRIKMNKRKHHMQVKARMEKVNKLLTG